MIVKLNEYVKTGNNINKNGVCIDVRSKVAYSILALYPNTTDTKVLNMRKSIYDFCVAYRSMSPYSLVETTELDLWKESDNYWFYGCIYNHRTTKTNQKYPSVNL